MALDIENGEVIKRAWHYNASVPESSRQTLLDEVNSYFAVGSNERAVVTFSVRSMLDLYLSVRKFPPGSEIIMTGINIPDMV